MIIKQLQTGCLSQFAYYIESDGEAAIIDPLRETKPYLELLQEQDSQLKYVLETHFHADFVSGHIDLAHKTQAKLVFGEKASTEYEIYHARDGEEFPLGRVKIKVIETPGHTVESVSYLLFDEEGNEHALFTGDALFVGDVGRPDLSSGNLSQEELASLLYDSLRDRIMMLPDNVLIYPAHGQGSSCGKHLGPETFSTLGEQKKTNYALQDMTKEVFIQSITEGLDKPPAYFFEDARINQEGYKNIQKVLDENIKALTAEKVEQAQKNEALILDTRKVDVFEKGHIPGSWNISLRGNYAPWVGALVPFGSQIVLVTEAGEEEESVLRLARVGYENVMGFLEGGITEWKKAGKETSQIESIDASAVPALLEDLRPVILDVRTQGEFQKGHLEGAVNIALQELPQHLNNLEKGSAYLVHCAGGYRSMVACSLLQAAGFTHVSNVAKGFNALQKVKGLSFDPE